MALTNIAIAQIAPPPTPNTAFLPTYKSAREGDVLRIWYEMPYLQQLAEGRVLEGALPQYRQRHGVVPLSIQLNNTLTQGKLASEAVFRVDESRLRNDDIPYVSHETFRSIQGGNIGFAPLGNLKILYALTAKTRCGSRYHEPERMRTIVAKTTSATDEHAESFFHGLEQTDVPKDWNISLTKEGGAQVFGCVAGLLDYQIGSKSVRRPFMISVQLEGVAVAAAVNEDASYNLFLKAGRSNYTHSLPISQFVASNSPERFGIRMQSDRSAFFRMRVAVRFTDGTELNLRKIEIDYFRPKGLRLTPCAAC